MKIFNRFFISLAATIVLTAAVSAGEVTKTTMAYAVRNATDTLRLDRYTTDGPGKDKPVLIFAFGGGFQGGHRDNSEYIPFFKFMAEQGYVVASIDYRTTLSNYNPASGIPGFATALQGAVTAAVEDLYTATGYILANACSWGINPSRIVVSGSSAGAITALEAEYLIASASPFASSLPEGFNYAGVIACAGAIVTDGAMQWQNARTCPIMLFHGDADSTVPFKTLAAGNLGMYGSQAVSDALKAACIPHELYIVRGADHSVAVSPMNENRYDMLAFLHEFVDAKSNRITVVNQSTPGASTDYKTDFTLLDYLRSNMPSR